MTELKPYMNFDALTVTGETVGENVSGAKVINPEVIRPISNPVHKEGGIAILRGNLAPQGSVVKMAAVSAKMMKHQGPAKVYDSEHEAEAAMKRHKIVAGDVVVIRYEGPRGGPGMQKCSYPPQQLRAWGLAKA